MLAIKPASVARFQFLTEVFPVILPFDELSKLNIFTCVSSEIANIRCGSMINGFVLTKDDTTHMFQTIQHSG